MASRPKSNRALVCAPRMPEIDRQGGSRRTFHLIEFLQEAGWETTFIAEHRVSGSDRYEAILQRRGVQTSSGLEAQNLHALLCTRRFALALLTSWPIAERCLPAIRRLSPDTRTLVDTVDLHFVRAARLSFLDASPDGGPPAIGAQFGADIVRELNTYAAADGVLTVSAQEKATLDMLIGSAVSAFVAPDCEEPSVSPVPIAERRGILFVGNFLYPANTDAVAYLCRDILPRVAARLRSAHPATILGNGLNDSVRALAAGLDDVHMIGWVHDLLPHLHRARVVVVPLRYGAGTKRKLIEALMAGCPVVATSIGAEGLSLEHGEHLLVADDADGFAHAIERVLREPALAERLARSGQARIAASHSRERARADSVDAVTQVLARTPKQMPRDGSRLDLVRSGKAAYDAMVDRVRAIACSTLPPSCIVAVVSRGDERLTALEGRRGWHFPQTADGVFSGSYPADGRQAVCDIEALRARGAQYLLFPATALWWLDHYVVFKEHLEGNYRAILRQDGLCVIFDLDVENQEATG
jgi:glycosyltransferase involved in cell wall biosynthesis